MSKHRVMRENFRKKTYHRQPGESVEEFSLFVKYRSLPPDEREDISKLLERVEGLTEEDLVRAYTTYDWHSRAVAFDAEAERQLAFKKVRQLKELEKRQGIAGRMAQKIGIEQIERLMKKAAADPDFELSIGQTQQLCDFGFRHERTSLGEAETITEIKGGVSVTTNGIAQVDLDFSKLTDDELRLYRQLRNKAKGLGAE